MEKTLMLFACSICLLIGCSSSGGNVNVPEAVKTKLTSLYPNTGTTKWEMEDGNYEATFEQDKMETSVILSPAGNILLTETEIDVTLLPQPVKDYVTSQLGGKQISSAAKMTDPNGLITYEAEVDKTDYLFDGNGQYTGKEDEKSEDKDDKD